MPDRFFADLQNCQTLEAVGDLFAQAIAPHGFTACACGAFMPAERGPETHFYFQKWPLEWIKLYQERNFVAADYSVAEARRRIAPFTWREAGSERVLSREEQALWATAQEWGWEDGISVPIHGPGGYFGLVAMAASARTWSSAERYRLHAMAVATHERCRMLAGRAIVANLPTPLSLRELECLRWVAAGKTDWEIATIAGIGEATVKTHVDAARKKLGAKNRAQAVARLVLGGLS